MSASFTGVLAVLGKRTLIDGRQLGQPDDALHRPLPLPIIGPGGSTEGRIDRVWLDGDLLRYSGVITSEDAARRISEQSLIGHIDVDPDGSFDYDHDTGILLCTGWKVMAATLLSSEWRAWAEMDMQVGEWS